MLRNVGKKKKKKQIRGPSLDKTKIIIIIIISGAFGAKCSGASEGHAARIQDGQLCAHYLQAWPSTRAMYAMGVRLFLGLGPQKWVLVFFSPFRLLEAPNRSWYPQNKI